MATAAPPTLEPIIGAGLIGMLLAAPLLGVYSVQVYSYFGKYPKDPIWMKTLVYFLWIVLAAQYAVNIHAIYAYLIQDYGHPDRLGTANGDFLSYAVFDSVTAVIVQCFFARRLYLIIRTPILRWLCAIVIVSLSVLGLVSGLLLFAKGFEITFFSKFRTLTWLSDLWLGSNVACDTIITFFMCITLHRSRTGIPQTNRLINKLIAYSIQTGASTSFVEIFCLATATSSGFHFGHILVIFPLSGLYCNSFLVNLHARVATGPGVPDDCVISTHSGVSFAPNHNTVVSTFKAKVQTLTPATSSYTTDETTSKISPFVADDIEMARQAK